MKTLKHFPMLFFVLCTVALLIPYIYASTVNSVFTTASDPPDGSLSYQATFNSQHQGSATFSPTNETGNYTYIHELRYPNASVKNSASGSGQLNYGNSTFNLNQSNTWSIPGGSPTGTYSHFARTEVSVPGNTRSQEDTKTFNIN